MPLDATKVLSRGQPEDHGRVKRFGLKILLFFNHLLFWLIIWPFGNLLMRTYFRLSSENRPDIPGAFIIAANHTSLLDGILMQAVMTRRVSFMLTVMFFNIPWLRWFFKLVFVIPVQEGMVNKQALEGAVRKLRAGYPVGIFPEGGISKDGKLKKGKSGIAVLSELTMMPVVPAAIIGAFEAMPRQAKFPRPKKIHVRFGEVIPPLQPGEGSRKEAYRAYVARVMEAIAELQKTEK